MKPNTLVLGFYSRDLPVNTLDTLHRRLLRKKSIVLRYILRDRSLEKFAAVDGKLPDLRKDVRIAKPTHTAPCSDDTLFFFLQPQELSAEEYVSLIQVCAT